ncbi:MAG: Ig-like domain-containing protein [Comamonas sp.]
MALPFTSSSHRDLPVAEGARFVASPDDSVNFLLNIPREDLSSYMRSGNDLVIAFKNGTSLQIADFFLRGVDAHHLIVIDGNARWWVSLTPQTMGDGALDASFETVEDDSSAALLGILGAVGLIAAASGGGGGGVAPTPPTVAPPAPPPPAAPPAPPPARPVIDTVSGQRTASGDFLTGKETVDVVGHGALPNGKLSVFVDGVLAGTTLADANGKWTYTAAKLPEGLHAISVTQTDAQGQTSEPAAVNVVVDTIAPPAPQIDSVTDDAGTIAGLVGQGSSTDDSTPTLNGIAEAGSTVRMFDGSTQIGVFVVDASGRWSFTPAALDEGLHRLTLTATDAAGNVSNPSEPFVFTVDTSPPKIDGIETSQAPRPTITGHTEPGSIVRIYHGDAELGQTKADEQGNWRFQPKLNDGDYHLTVTATDAAGNQSPRSPVDLTVDTTAPMLEVIGVSVAPRPTITGRAEPGSVVKVYHGDTELGQAEMNKDGNWRFQPHLQDGDYDLTVMATDAVGNQSPRLPVDLMVDTTPPMLEIMDVSAGASPMITGRAEPGSIVRVYNGRTLVGRAETDEGGNWHFQPALKDGDYHLTVTATDAVGNQSARLPVDLMIDTRPPVEETPSEETAGPEGPDRPEGPEAPLATGAKITGSAEPGSKVTIFNGKEALGEALADENGNWSYRLNIDDGDYKLTVKTKDVTGNYDYESTVDLTVNSGSEAIIEVKLHAPETGVAETAVVVASSGESVATHATSADEPLLSSLTQHALTEGESPTVAVVDKALLPQQIHVVDSLESLNDFGWVQSAVNEQSIDWLLSDGKGGAVSDGAKDSSLFLPGAGMDTILEIERGAAVLASSSETALTLNRETADLERLLAHQAIVV